MWGCFLMSGVKILHFLKDWWKSISIHQNYTMALSSKITKTLRILREDYSMAIVPWFPNLHLVAGNNKSAGWSLLLDPLIFSSILKMLKCIV